MTEIKYDAVQGVGYVLDGDGHWTEEDHPRDEKGMFTVSGNTFPVKDRLQSMGFQYHATTKTWFGDIGAYHEARRSATSGGNKKDRERAKAIYDLHVSKGDPRESAQHTGHETGRGNVYSDPYNRGIYGQMVHGQKRIPGSAPDDFE